MRAAAPTAPASAAQPETTAKLLERLRSSEQGLTGSEAARRLAAARTRGSARGHHGRWLLERVRGVLNPLTIILLVAATAAAAIGQ